MNGLPDFLVIGAARSGTTALHSYLRQAPDVFLPRLKEPNFFAYEGQVLHCKGPGADFINNSVTDIDTYRALFAQAPASAILGEASPLYLFEKRAPERIKHHVPEARLIVILRNPVDQAYSHFLQATKLRVEPLDSFTDALHAETKRLADGWQPMFGYSRFPRYGEQLARYLAIFPRDQILIRRYETLEHDPAGLVAEILEFIGANATFRPDLSERHNAGGVPRNRRIQDFLMKPNPVTGLLGLVLPVAARRRIRDQLAALNMQQSPQALSEEARAILTARLRDDVAHLSTLLDEDFMPWLAKS